MKPHKGSQPLNAGVSRVAWNKKVKTIMASGSTDGDVKIWDLRQQREVMTVKNSQQMRVHRSMFDGMLSSVPHTDARDLAGLGTRGQRAHCRVVQQSRPGGLGLESLHVSNGSAR